MSTFNISTLRHLMLASTAAVVAGTIAATAQSLPSNTSQDALFRAQVRQQMQSRSMRQRLNNQEDSRRALQSAARAARKARQAIRRAQSRR